MFFVKVNKVEKKMRSTEYWMGLQKNEVCLRKKVHNILELHPLFCLVYNNAIAQSNQNKLSDKSFNNTKVLQDKKKSFTFCDAGVKISTLEHELRKTFSFLNKTEVKGFIQLPIVA